jgi:SAM-dependent methyltransferase
MPKEKNNYSDRAALRGEPSYIWRAGQERRLAMMLSAAGDLMRGSVFVDGCGVGEYLMRLAERSQIALGLDIEFERAHAARQKAAHVVCGAGENLPIPNGCFDVVVSHEVLEHVQDDSRAVREIFRVLKKGGRLLLFCPNRWYPFETHGIYWRGKYKFGNIPLVNYLPRGWRDKLAPHVRAFTKRDLHKLFAGSDARFIKHTVIFGAYDSLIARWPVFGKLLRCFLQWLEKTPLRVLGLSHFWVIEKKL